ncbi:hypothetical protein ABH309_11790 [Chromobacterium piscinae]|uniref:Uncharacterized protein n=1 Tax=Chromobacterium piscinae TaxID=686831 RepID=A0ABV0H4X5_9NEIS
MKLNKKHWIALVGSAIALTVGLFAYWTLNQKENGVERLALDGQPGKQLASDIMDKIYGHDHYDAKKNCWNVQHAFKDGGSYAYCMQPIALDRVRENREERLYLFASAGMEDASHADGVALVGMFVMDGAGKEMLAGDKGMPFFNGFGHAADSVQLMRLSSKGDMGWFAEGGDAYQGVTFSYPQLFIAKGKKIVKVSKSLVGKDDRMAEGLTFHYQAVSDQGAARLYPIAVIVKNEADKTIANLRFRFDSKAWQYVCADQACEQRKGIPPHQSEDEGASGEAESDAPPANANEALFGNGRRLSEADLKDVLAQMEVHYVTGQSGTGFIQADGCDEPFSLDGYFKQDGQQEQLWIRGGNSCTSGVTGASAWLFIRDESGSLHANLGFPVADIQRTADVSEGVHDLRVSAAGFCDGVWRWDGKRFKHLKNIATQPGGCDGR